MKDSEKRPQFKQVITYATLLLMGAGIGVWAVMAKVSAPVMTMNSPLNANSSAMYAPAPVKIAPANVSNNAIAIAAPIPGNTNFISDAVERTGPAVVRSMPLAQLAPLNNKFPIYLPTPCSVTFLAIAYLVLKTSLKIGLKGELVAASSLTNKAILLPTPM